MADDWRSAADRLAISVRGQDSSVAEVSELLDTFNGYFYPLEGLKLQVEQKIMQMHTNTAVDLCYLRSV